MKRHCQIKRRAYTLLMPNTIISVRITQYRDNGQTSAWIGWSDGSSTHGKPDGAHMEALLARAQREGVQIVRDTAGWQVR